MTNNKFEEFTKTLQELALYAKVFSHPARIAIINILAEEKEIKTSIISDNLPISRTTVSQHLKELKELGIIKGTIDGLKIHYCIDIERINEIKKVFNDFFEQITTASLCDCE